MVKLKNKSLFVLLFIFIIYTIKLLLTKTYFFWDETIYLSMSRYIISFGKLGFYEMLRPPFFPLSIGILSSIGIEKSIAGHIIVILSSLASIVLVYDISKDLFNKKGAIITTFLFSISSTFVFYSSRILNGNVSMFMILLTVYLFIKKKNLFVVGLIAGLSTITRFPNILILAIIGLYIIFINFNKNNLKQTILTYLKKGLLLFLGFITTLLPYLIFNQLKFGNPILPFQEASRTIHIVSQTVNESIFYYPLHLILESIFLVFILYSIVYLIKNKPKKQYLLLLIITSLSFLIYYSTVGHKEMRYLLVIFPYLFILSFYGLDKLTKKLNLSLKKTIYILLIIFCILQSISLTNDYYKTYAVEFDEEIGEQFFGADLQGLSILSGPQVLAYQDIQAKIIYSINENMFEYYESFKPNNYLINTCSLFCPHSDDQCELNKEDFIQDLKVQYNIIFNKNIGSCKYYVFSN